MPRAYDAGGGETNYFDYSQAQQFEKALAGLTPEQAARLDYTSQYALEKSLAAVSPRDTARASFERGVIGAGFLQAAPSRKDFWTALQNQMMQEQVIPQKLVNSSPNRMEIDYVGTNGTYNIVVNNTRWFYAPAGIFIHDVTNGQLIDLSGGVVTTSPLGAGTEWVVQWSSGRGANLGVITLTIDYDPLSYGYYRAVMTIDLEGIGSGGTDYLVGHAVDTFVGDNDINTGYYIVATEIGQEYNGQTFSYVQTDGWDTFFAGYYTIATLPRGDGTFNAYDNSVNSTPLDAGLGIMSPVNTLSSGSSYQFQTLIKSSA
jgi:hypothetical protein